MIDYSKLDYAPLLDAYDKQTISKAIVGEISGKGHKVYVFGFPAYLPYTQTITGEALYEGQEIDVCIIKIMPETNNIVVSRKVAIEQQNNLDAEKLEIGSIVTARVKSIAKYGAFATVGGIDGLIHNSELSYTRITDPSEVVSVGQEIQVKIVNITEDESGRKKIELSYKQAYPNPWDSVQVEAGDIIDAKVVNISSYGIFISVDNVEALVHKSELSWTKKNPEPSSYAAVGDIIRVKIQNVDLEKRQISASLREVQGDPWASLTLVKGDVIEGKITNATNFGFFIKIADDLEGLLHYNDLGWTKIEKETMKETLKVGDEVRVVVTEINKEKERISLSLKHLN